MPASEHGECPLSKWVAGRCAAARAAACPVEDWLAFLGHRWNALVLWHLRAGPLRHGALQALLPGITAKVLGESGFRRWRRAVCWCDRPWAAWPRTR